MYLLANEVRLYNFCHASLNKIWCIYFSAKHRHVFSQFSFPIRGICNDISGDKRFRLSRRWGGAQWLNRWVRYLPKEPLTYEFAVQVRLTVAPSPKWVGNQQPVDGPAFHPGTARFLPIMMLTAVVYGKYSWVQGKAPIK